MDYNDLIKLEKAKKQWEESFDTLVKLVDSNDGLLRPDVYISTSVRIDTLTRKTMRLLYVTVSHRWITDDIVLNFIDEDAPETLTRVIVAKAFEAKAFGDIREVPQLFDFLILQFNSNNKMIKNMAKVTSFKKGALISAKKFNGEQVLGIYQYTYDDGSHCIFDGKKKWCINPNDIHQANEEETKIIQETIIKSQREAEKKKKAEEAAARAAAETEETLTEEDMEEAAEDE